VLHSLGPANPNPPGYPPFFFQFPEGWFKFAFPFDKDGRYYAPDYALAQGQPRPIDAENFKPDHNFQNDKPMTNPHELVKRSDTNLQADKGINNPPELINFQNDIQKNNPRELVKRTVIKSEASKLPPSQCTPKKNIVFVKTHKTGSSTVTNILMRYAENNKLKVALPIKGVNDLGGYPAPMDDKLVDGNKVNIIAHHFRHSRSVDNLLDNPRDTKRITILRNPVHQVKSTFSFFRDQPPFDSWFDASESVDNRMQKFYNDPRKIYNTNSNWYFRTKNFQTFDVGEQQQIFDLVLLTDYFNESLVLLKNLMCWDWDDVAYLKFKESADTSITAKNLNVDNNLTAKIMDWNSKDAELYRKHNTTFWKKIENYPNFKRDLSILKSKINELESACVEEYKAYPKKPWLKFAKLKQPASEKCKRAALVEDKYAELLGPSREDDEEKVMKVHETSGRQLSLSSRTGEYFEKGNWRSEDEFLPKLDIKRENCPFDFELSKTKVETCTKAARISIIGDSRAKILGTTLSARGVINIQVLWSTQFTEMKKSQIEKLKSSKYIIIGEQWILNAEKQRFDIEAQMKYLKTILEDLDTLNVPVVLMGAEPAVRKAIQWKIDASRKIYNEKLKSFAAAYDNVHYFINHENTARGIDGENLLVDSTFKLPPAMTNISDEIPRSLYADTNILLNFFCQDELIEKC